MVGATHFDHKEDDTQGYGSPYVKQRKDYQKSRLGGTIEENPSRVGW